MTNDVYYEMHPELKSLFVAVPNTGSNEKLLNYLFTITEPVSERYTNWNKLVAGDKERRFHAEEFAFSFKAGSVMLGKLQKRFPSLRFAPI